MTWNIFDLAFGAATPNNIRINATTPNISISSTIKDKMPYIMGFVIIDNNIMKNRERLTLKLECLSDVENLS